MAGRLYRLKRYPGLRPAQHPEDWVAGEVYRLRTPAATLRVLDAYEAREYRRVRRTAYLADGRGIRCWVYLYGKPLPWHARVAPGVWPPAQ